MRVRVRVSLLVVGRVARHPARGRARAGIAIVRVATVSAPLVSVARDRACKLVIAIEEIEVLCRAIHLARDQLVGVRVRVGVGLRVSRANQTS